MTLATLLLACLPLALPVPTASGPRDGYDTARERAVGELAAALSEHAAWCQKSRLYGECDRVWGAVLAWDPDHAEARKALGYKRDKSGAWTRAKEPRPRKNFAEDLLPEAKRRELVEVGKFRDKLLSLLEHFADELPRSRRDAELALLLELNPEDSEVRRLLGEVWLEDAGKWVLPESRATVARRKELAAMVARAKAGVPAVSDSKAEDWERDLGVDWHGFKTCGAVRVVSTGPPDEAEAAVRGAQGIRLFFDELVGHETLMPNRITGYLVEPAGRDAFLRRFPGLADADRERYRDLVGAWLTPSGADRRVGGTRRTSASTAWRVRCAPT